MRLLKLLPLILLVNLVAPNEARAQSPGSQLLTGTSNDGILVAYDGEAITIAGTAIGFTTSKISPTCTDCPLNVKRATRADCVTDSAAAEFRALENAVTPTAAVGKKYSAGIIFTVFGYENIANFLAIRTAAVSITMYCTYSRPK